MKTRYVRIAVVTAAAICLASCSGGSRLPVTAEGPFAHTDTTVAESLETRAIHANAVAAERGADVSISVLDRDTDSHLGVAGETPIETASVAKLFIAEDLFSQDAHGSRPLSDDDRTLMLAMLESSDDTAANILWDAVGGPDVIDRVAQRYELTSTTPPSDGMWWNTLSTTDDLVTFYNGVLDDFDQLGTERVDQFVDYLRQSTPEGADGYDQRFGLPEALFGEPVIGVKQGWMCCISDQWIHLSTGIIGQDNRYIVAIGSRETVQYADAGEDEVIPDTSYTDATDDESALHARDTVTGITQILFPTGIVDDWTADLDHGRSTIPEAAGP